MAALKPLVTTQWLTQRLGANDMRVFDCRFDLAEPEKGRASYTAGHIPWAVYVSLDDDLTGTEGPGRHPLPPADQFRARMEELGVGTEHTVVAYDEGDGGYAPRLWWMLRSLGHPRTYVLDGGWAAWTAAQLPVATTTPRFEPSEFDAAPHWTGTVDRSEIDRADRSLTLVDARAEERYRGLVEPIDPVAGHIPDAVNIPYTGNIGRDGHFLSEQEIRARFAAVADDPTLVVYCGSGVTACSNLLALEVAGRSDALLYPGSWSDWCTSGGDVARG
ncbi:MAG: sulfurtransferase [Acidimicrobiia bacterium]|nr:sulfurtransferase [Acidimicrobiia bacterium]